MLRYTFSYFSDVINEFHRESVAKKVTVFVVIFDKNKKIDALIEYKFGFGSSVMHPKILFMKKL